MTSFYVLYNDCYGGFTLSVQFEAEYEARTSRKVDYMKLGNESIRRDPVAIAIFNEYGSEWCSGPCSELALHECPIIFERYWEIDEYDGNETVRIDSSAALADILETFLQTNDLITLRRQYTAICSAANRIVVLTGPDSASTSANPT
jgi:hypothetical protein